MMRIFDLLFPPRADELLLRHASLDTFLECIAPKIAFETHPETITLLSFANPFTRAAIHEAKYHGSRHAFSLLGAALADYLRDTDDFTLGLQAPNVILVPVPLGKERMIERGHNQVAEIARYALEILGPEHPLTLDTTLLERSRETASQVSLPREKREENMRGAFRATRPADPSCTYIVLDDVITTGATLQTAINTLRDAGAKNITPLALAH